jgi:hypothetical protein
VPVETTAACGSSQATEQHCYNECTNYRADASLVTTVDPPSRLPSPVVVAVSVAVVMS